MNTRVSYEYRDGANYHWHNDVVVRGTMTDALWERVIIACEERHLFIAHQVGLREVFGYIAGDHIDSDPNTQGFEYNEETDHCWHSFGTSKPWELTTEIPTDKRSVEQFVEAFEAAAESKWQVFYPPDRFDF